MRAKPEVRLSVQWQIRPSSGDMAILTDISSNNWLSIIMVPENPPQTEGRMQIPSLLAGAKGTIDINFVPIPILNRSPDMRRFEVLENPSEKHVIPLLFNVNTSRPITNVQRITSKSAPKQLISLLPAQIPNPRCQMRPHRPTDLPPLGNTKLPIGDKNTLLHFGRTDLGVENIGGFGIVIHSIEIQIIVERPSTIRGRSREIRMNLKLGRRGVGFVLGVGQIEIILVRTQLSLEAKIGILEKNAGVDETRTTDGKLMKRGPATGRNRVADEKIGDEGRDGLGTLGLPADVADCRGEFGGNAGQSSPVAGIVFELEENVEKNVVWKGGEERIRHWRGLRGRESGKSRVSNGA